MTWTVETLNATVDEEIEALPADMRARLTRIAALIATAGLENVHVPHIKHIEGPVMGNADEGQGWHITGAVCNGKTKTGGNCACIHQEDGENAPPRN